MHDATAQVLPEKALAPREVPPKATEYITNLIANPYYIYTVGLPQMIKHRANKSIAKHQAAILIVTVQLALTWRDFLALIRPFVFITPLALIKPFE